MIRVLIAASDVPMRIDAKDTEAAGAPRPEARNFRLAPG